ncbi:MAG: hypothetical protein WAU28_01190 [Candidatus Moraniibacteriota bacterium]
MSKHLSITQGGAEEPKGKVSGQDHHQGDGGVMKEGGLGGMVGDGVGGSHHQHGDGTGGSGLEQT